MTCVSSFGPKYNIFCSMTSFITFSSPSPLLSRRHRHGRQYPRLAFPCYQIILLKFSYCALYIWYQHTYPKKSQVIKTIEQWLNLSPDITPFDFLQREFKKLVFVPPSPWRWVNEGRHCGCRSDHQPTKGLEWIQLQDWGGSYDMGVHSEHM